MRAVLCFVRYAGKGSAAQMLRLLMTKDIKKGLASRTWIAAQGRQKFVNIKMQHSVLHRVDSSTHI